MTLLIFKYLSTAFIIVLVSEIAKRMDRLGALIAALPFVTLIVMIWLTIETQNPEKVASHAYYTFWYVLPTLPMFLLIPFMIRQGVGVYISIASGCLLTFLLFALTAWIGSRFGINLW